MNFNRLVLCLCLGLVSVAATRDARAQGFQLNRYEPTPAGTTFFAVDRPWYSSTRFFAAGITLNYGHDPLVYARRLSDGSIDVQQNVVEHQLLGHLDLAGSFLDRVLLSATLPITLLERGTAAGGAAPLDGAAVGDPRVGLMIRLWHHADKDAFSIHFGGDIWIPIGAQGSHAGDANVRGIPKLVIGGIGANRHFRWSISAGYLLRYSSTIGSPGNTAGSLAGQELRFGFGLGYTNTAQTLHVGPELLIATVPTDGHGFMREFTSLELLVGANYLIKELIQIGAAVGTAFLREPGTPDVRVLFRLAYAPLRRAVKDRDKDGILDDSDACPDEKGPKSLDPKINGCPDRDGDGVIDARDECPDVPMGNHRDPEHLGCPIGDRDRDGVPDDKDICPDVKQGKVPDPARAGCPADRDNDEVIDELDLCPDVPQGEHPDRKKLGCPLDTDHDGVPDDRDLCPAQPAGKMPDPARRGCPADRDRDSIIDEQDLCPDEPAGTHPDPDRIGCPLADSDHDSVPDVVDACPDVPGAPDPDPKKNGCPGLVTIRNGMIVILAPVFFATNKDVILAKSFPVLQAVANALTAQPEIKRIAIEGHTDTQGKLAANMSLSDRRALSVMNWLLGKSISADRMESHGYGPTRPIQPNSTVDGRAANRRVEFRIVDPAQPTRVE